MVPTVLEWGCGRRPMVQTLNIQKEVLVLDVTHPIIMHWMYREI